MVSPFDTKEVKKSREDRTSQNSKGPDHYLSPDGGRGWITWKIKWFSRGTGGESVVANGV